MNVYVRGPRVRARPGRRRVRRVHPLRGPRAVAGRRGRARLSGRARRGRAAGAGAALRAARARRRVHRRDHAPPRRERAGRGAARQLLAVGRGRAPAEAPPRPADGRDVPHAGARQGRRRHRRRSRRARPRRASRDRVLRSHARVHRVAEHDQLASLYDAVPERVEVVPPGVDHSVFFPDDPGRRQAPPRSRRPPGAAVRGPDPAVEGRRPRGPLPRRARRPRRDAARRGRPQRSRRRRRAGARARARARARRRRPTCTSCRPSRTTGSPTTTAPPTCASFRPAPSRSVSSRSRPPRAARPWSRRRSVGCGRSSTTARPDSSSTIAIPAAYAALVAKLLGDPELAAEMGATASARSRKYSWSITAARLRRLYGDLVARGLVRCD